MSSAGFQRFAVDDDEIGQFSDFQRTGDVVFVKFVSGLNGGSPQNRFAREAVVFAQLSAEFWRRVGSIRARHANFQGEPFVEEVDGPIAAKSDACAGGRQEPRGFEDLDAFRVENVG